MPLSKETKDRIATQAIREYPANQYMSADLFFKRQGQQESYIAGAEKEAERAAGLVEALESIQKTVLISHEMQGNNPTANICRNTAMEALTKYNNSK